jgi:cytochrome c biogenesis protein CcdA
VFVALGASASVFGSLIRAYADKLAMVAGVVIIVMGLHFLGVTRIAMMYREKRMEIPKPVGLWGAYVMGLAFAFGWTPCIGPILAVILAIAASEATVAKGAGLLAGLLARLWAFRSSPRPSRSSRSRNSRALPRLLPWVERTMGRAAGAHRLSRSSPASSPRRATGCSRCSGARQDRVRS